MTVGDQAANDARFRGVHDIGGMLDEPFGATEHDYLPWEKRTHALRELLARKGLLKVDELRRAIESQGEAEYRNRTYYEQWIQAMATIMIERGVVDSDELAAGVERVRNRRV